MEVEEKNENEISLLFVITLLVWMISAMFVVQFHYYKIQPYSKGYQYFVDSPELSMFSTDKYRIEYYPDYPGVGDNILIFVNIDSLTETTVLCLERIL